MLNRKSKLLEDETIGVKQKMTVHLFRGLYLADEDEDGDEDGRFLMICCES